MTATGSSYTGYVPKAKDTIQREPSSIDAATFFQKYVHARRPVVLQGPLATADGSDVTRLADLAHLRRVGARSVVRIEPFDDAVGTFGTAAARTTTALPAFLDLLEQDAERGRWYLTTQYDDEGKDGDGEEDDTEREPRLDPICPAPTDKFVLDFPLHPPVMGNLVLQQCNLWIGNSADGSSSGLHHDFHDNLYLLLRGRKRLVLFPPSAHPHLHMRGALARCWPNGLLAYKDSDADSDEEDEEEGTGLRADGLDALDAARWRLVYWKSRCGTLRDLPAEASKKERKVHALAKKEVDASVAAAEEEVQRLLSAADAGSFSSSSDDDDEEEALDGAEDEDDWSAGSAEDGEAVLAALEDPGADTDTMFTKAEPPSFSRIPPRALHAHFGLSSSLSGAAPQKPKKGALAPTADCPPPLVVDLAPGDALFLPAGWLHEVTSGGGTHIAFNYWFHPPDGETFERPYEDAQAWAAIGGAVERTFDTLRTQAAAEQAAAAKRASAQPATTQAEQPPSTTAASAKRKGAARDAHPAKRAKTEAGRGRPGAATRAKKRAANVAKRVPAASGA